jgi:hypothetical protein
MNAPAQITPARERYLPIVRHLLPGCMGEELQLRCSILLMRDKATSNMRHCSEEAHGILGEINRLAARYAYESMPIEELQELRRQMVQLTSCASGLEMFAWRLANPGGADAGG